MKGALHLLNLKTITLFSFSSYTEINNSSKKENLIKKQKTYLILLALLRNTICFSPCVAHL